VPTTSTGIAVAWGSHTMVAEVTALAWSYGGNNIGRSASYNPQPGSVSLTAMGSVPGISLVGSTGVLTITGGGMDLTHAAELTSRGSAAEVNGVTRYPLEFTLIG
jgi:hypothetical protein